MNEEPRQRQTAAPMPAIARAGRNCWRRAKARRVAFLIDADAYFAAFADAAERARRSVMIVGWDFNSRIALRRRERRDDGTAMLGDFLNQLARRRRGLHVYVLDWDFAPLYALDREMLASYRFAWTTHRRFHFEMDDNHPFGGAHHQKIAVVDDAIAFVGGIDFGACRWDTPEHAADDPRRVDPWGNPYGPFHDVQMAVDGEAAAALGALARERWERATGTRLPAPRQRGDPWPTDLEPQMEDVTVAIARTDPAHGGRSEVREVEALFLDAIASARRFLYIENQYLTAGKIADALCERLREKNGPQIVVVGPRHCEGWLEETAMGVLRARLLRRLREADHLGRLRVYYPTVPGLEDRRISVHAKVLIVDDSLVRIGSANLNNRSMGLDTECDLAVESEGDPRMAAAIGELRDRLLAEHLGREPREVGERIGDLGLIGAIDDLGGGERRLEPLEGEVADWLDSVVPAVDLLDPERPIDGDTLLRLVAPEPPEGLEPHRWRWVPIPLALLGIAAAWRWTALGTWIEPAAIAATAAPWVRGPTGPLLVIGAYVVGSIALIPITALIVATVLVLGPLAGAACALAGALAAAAATYAIGRAIGRNAVRHLAGTRVADVRRRLRRSGVLSVAAVRLLPIAPFSVVNIIAGAAPVGIAPFLLGTLLGMTPGILTLTVFAGQLRRALRDPGALNAALLAGFTLVLAAAALWLRRRRRPAPGGADRA